MLIMAVAIAALGASIRLELPWFMVRARTTATGQRRWPLRFDVTKRTGENARHDRSERGSRSSPVLVRSRQQFGLPESGWPRSASFMSVRWPPRAILLLLSTERTWRSRGLQRRRRLYLFLPSHYVVALSAGAGIAAITTLCARVSSRSTAAAAGALILVYPAWRGYDTLPAVDRSSDRRAEQLLDELTTPPRRMSLPGSLETTVFGLDTNWQVQNALEYYMRERKPGIAWFTTEQLEWLQDLSSQAITHSDGQCGDRPHGRGDRECTIRSTTRSAHFVIRRKFH